MASDNKSLGRFHLDGIPPAPRGIPQIEVTFDIDADGILQVSAKDKGTGKEQSIRITGSTKLPDEEIDRMKKEAEDHAEEDRKRKESVEIRNNAESLIHTSEKTLEDLKEKVTSDDKDKIEKNVKSLREALSGDDLEKIKEKTDELTKTLQDISTKIYQQAAQEAAAKQQADSQQAQAQQDNESWSGHPSDKDDKTIDADFEVKNDDKDKKDKSEK